MNNITVNTVCDAFIKEGFKSQGGSEVWRVLENDEIGIKVFYNDYKTRSHIIVCKSYDKKYPEEQDNEN